MATAEVGFLLLVCYFWLLLRWVVMIIILIMRAAYSLRTAQYLTQSSKSLFSTTYLHQECDKGFIFDPMHS